MQPDLNTGPLALAGACLISGILVPLPEDIAILIGGWQMHQGSLPVFAGTLAAMFGTLGRDALAFGAGRLAMRRALAGGPLARLLRSQKVIAARERIDKHGDRLLFAARFAVGMRAALYFAGGTTGKPFRRFVTLDLLGLTITTPLLLCLGWYYGPEATAWLDAALAHQRAMVGIVLVITLGAGIARGRSRRAARRAAAERSLVPSETGPRQTGPCETGPRET